MAPLKCFFVGTFLFFYVSQQGASAQSFGAKKLEKFSTRYAITKADDFLEFLNHSNEPKEAISFLEACENYLAENRCISFRLPIGEPPFLLSERNWISAEHTILFYFPLEALPSAKASLQDRRGKVIDPSILEMNTDIYPSFSFRGEELSLNRATLGMFFIALSAINERYNRPRFNIRILIDNQANRDDKEVKDLVKAYGDDLYADLIFVFNGDRNSMREPIVEIPSAINSSERIIPLKRHLKDLFGESIRVITPQTNQTETVESLSESLAIPIVSFPLYSKGDMKKNELTFLQFTEGIKTFIAVLQTRF